MGEEAPEGDGVALNAVDAGDDEDGGVEDAEGAFGFGREVDVTGVSRRVKETPERSKAAEPMKMVMPRSFST